ncbi:MAG: hypothetical protein ACR5K1_04905 [Wolbachia sp.]
MSNNSERTLVTNDNNPGSVGTQTENSFSKDPLGQKIESLGKEIKSLRKQNQLNSGIIRLGVIGLIGYIIATNWSTIASAFATAGTATAAASPVIGIVVGAIIGAAVLVGVSYAAWRYRAEIKAGFKYAAEKTVEGAEYTARKIKAGVVYIKGKAKEGASTAADRLGGSLKEFAHSGEHPMESQLVQELLQQKGIREVVNDTIKIAKADNSSVLPAIKSAMKSRIESAIRLEPV